MVLLGTHIPYEPHSHSALGPPRGAQCHGPRTPAPAAGGLAAAVLTPPRRLRHPGATLQQAPAEPRSAGSCGSCSRRSGPVRTDRAAAGCGRRPGPDRCVVLLLRWTRVCPASCRAVHVPPAPWRSGLLSPRTPGCGLGSRGEQGSCLWTQYPTHLKGTWRCFCVKAGGVPCEPLVLGTSQ